MRTSYIPVKKQLRKNNSLVRPVSGISMMPMLNQNTDTVKFIKPLNKIQTGDVVLYKVAPKKYAISRVCSQKQKCFVIRGDNCVNSEYVPKRNIVAVMDGYYKCGKYIPADDPDYLRYTRKVCDEGKPLIPEEWRYLVKLYASAVTGQKAEEAPQGLSWEDIYLICQRQKITSAVAIAISKLKVQPDGQTGKKFKESADMGLNRMLLFAAEREKIYCEFEKNNIRYIPLKAIVIERLYPEAGMREYSDNDILFEKNRQPDVLNIMTTLGYKPVYLKGNHDIYYKQPIFNFELHRDLFAQDSPYAEMFKNIWDKAVPDRPDSAANHMSDEDFYLHFIAHFAKHSKKNGTGMRPLADLYLLKEHYAKSIEFRTEYVNSELAKMGLVSFEMKMSSLAKKIFSGGKLDEYTLRCLMCESVYGSVENMLDNKISRYGKVGYIMTRIFPAFSQMSSRFSFLGSFPFLYPACWFWRIVCSVLAASKREIILRELKKIVWFKAKRQGYK